MQTGLTLDNDAAVSSGSNVVKDDFVSATSSNAHRWRDDNMGIKGPHFGLVEEVAIKSPSHGLAKRRRSSYNCIVFYKCSRFFDAVSP